MSTKNIKKKSTTCILLSEFDIDKGSTLKHQYPEIFYDSKIQDSLADQMLPDGSERQEWSFNLFFLNRKPPSNQISSTPSSDSIFDEWAIISDTDFASAALSDLGHDNESPPSASSSSSAAANASQQQQQQPLLYALNVVHTKRDSSKRGATIRSLAVVSECPFFEGFKSIMLVALQEYFEQRKVSIIQDLYTAIEENTALQHHATIYQQCAAFIPYLSTKFTQCVSLKWRGTLIPQVLPFYGVPVLTSPDVSIINLIYRFGSSVMGILDAVLSEQRVLVLGVNTPPSQVISVVLSICAMVVPPYVDIFETRVFPYVNLNNLDEFVNVSGFIVGTTNPFFLGDATMWDLVVNINPQRNGNMMSSSSMHSKSISNPSVSLDDDSSHSSAQLDAVCAHMKRGQLIWSPRHAQQQSSTAGKLLRKISGQSTPETIFYNHIRKAIGQGAGEDHIRTQFRLYVLRLLDVAIGINEDNNVRKQYESYDNRKLSKIKKTPSFLRIIDQEAFFGGRQQEKPTITKSGGLFDIAQHVRKLEFILREWEQHQTIVQGAFLSSSSSSSSSSLSSSSVLAPGEQSNLLEQCIALMMNLCTFCKNQSDIYVFFIQINKYNITYTRVHPLLVHKIPLQVQSRQLFDKAQLIENHLLTGKIHPDSLFGSNSDKKKD